MNNAILNIYYHPYLKSDKNNRIWKNIIHNTRLLSWCNTIFRNVCIYFFFFLQKSKLYLERLECFLLYTDAVSIEGTAGAATEGRKGEDSSSGGATEGPGAAHTDRYQGKLNRLENLGFWVQVLECHLVIDGAGLRHKIQMYWQLDGYVVAMGFLFLFFPYHKWRIGIEVRCFFFFNFYCLGSWRKWVSERV